MSDVTVMALKDAEAAMQRAYGSANELLHEGNSGRHEQHAAAITFGLIGVGRAVLAAALMVSNELERGRLAVDRQTKAIYDGRQ